MIKKAKRFLVVIAMLLSVVLFSSCVPSISKARAKMNKANYNGERIYYDDLITFDDSGNKNYTFGKNIRNANYIYFFSNNDLGFSGYNLETFRIEHLFVLYFETKTDAEDFLSSAKKAVNLITNDLEKERETLENTLGEDSDMYKRYTKAIRNLKNYSFEISNKCVYFGTTDIANAFGK